MRLFFFASLFLGCQRQAPKPNAFLDLAYAEAQYNDFDSDACAYRFMYNNVSMPVQLSSCGITLDYPLLKAKVYVTYFDLSKSSLDTLFMDFENRLMIFGKGTQRINESTYEDQQKEVLGSCVTLIGDSPSNLHFFATDNKRHFISGSLLFSAAPNYDSLAPAIGYIKNDVQKMLETLRWQ
jgi:gliding motility-associated lipoprotein GldD